MQEAPAERNYPQPSLQLFSSALSRAHPGAPLPPFGYPQSPVTETPGNARVVFDAPA
jgi:hypothetical protein